jgi:hypothetical protein
LHDYVLLNKDSPSKLVEAANLTSIRKVKVKGKAITIQAWTGRAGFRRLRLPDFMIVGT